MAGSSTRHFAVPGCAPGRGGGAAVRPLASGASTPRFNKCEDFAGFAFLKSRQSLHARMDDMRVGRGGQGMVAEPGRLPFGVWPVFSRRGPGRRPAPSCPAIWAANSGTPGPASPAARDRPQRQQRPHLLDRALLQHRVEAPARWRLAGHRAAGPAGWRRSATAPGRLRSDCQAARPGRCRATSKARATRWLSLGPQRYRPWRDPAGHARPGADLRQQRPRLRPAAGGTGGNSRKPLGQRRK